MAVAGEVGTSGEEAGDNGRGWIMLGLSSKDSCFYPNGNGSQQWVLSWEGMVVVATQSKIQGKRKGRRKDREAVVSDQALVSRHNSLGPISGFGKKTPPGKKKIADRESSPQRKNRASGGQWAEGKSQASGFSAQVPKDGYFFPGGGGAGSQGYKEEIFGLIFLPAFCFYCCGLPPSLGLRNQSGSCQLVLKQQVAKARRF